MILKVKNSSDEWVDIPSIIGPQGETGAKGDTGAGVASGGTTGQILKKKSGTDYDTEWGDAPATGVTSFNNRTGAVTPANGDYTAAQVGVSLSNGTITIDGSTITPLTEHQSLSAYRTASAQDVIDALLQSKTDNSLTTTAKTVVGAINELDSGKQDTITLLTTAEVDTIWEAN